MKKFTFSIIIICFLFAGCNRSITPTYSLKLWENQPAEKWEEYYPLGNGRIGIMPGGQIENETLVLNEISLWSGGVQDPNNPDAAKYLPEIRKLLFAGKNDQAQSLVYKTFACKGAGSGHGNGNNVPYGCFEILGNLHIDYQYSSPSKPHNYYRELNLNDAVAQTSFIIDDVKYTREYFTDFVNDVIVVRLYASKPGMLNFRVGIDRPQVYETMVENNELLMAGQLNNGTDGKGMQYQARVKIKQTGGELSSNDKQLKVEKAQEAIIIISATTDYKNPGFEAQCSSLLNKATEQPYTQIKSRHSEAFKKYFDRVNLCLNTDPAKDSLSTSRRLLAYASQSNDNGLVELYFQYARYLLISSTRLGLLPPNLQGLWANTIKTPWNGDYHMNINVQMNHWPAEITNLPELHRPLIELTKSLVEPGEKTAKAFYNGDGWVAHMMTNVWGYTAPGEHPSWGATNTGGAWLCAHLWEHYDYNRDVVYLKEIYPVLKGAAQFFLSTLVVEPKHGWLVTAPSTSPENTFYLPNNDNSISICMGPTMDNQLIRELFNNVIEACRILNADQEFCKKLQEAVVKLPPNRIGSDGRLMEWLEEYKEAEPQHRHVSHLYGLHPSNQITPDGTPELAEAARKTLEVRGDGGTGWSRAWKINFWARLGDGNHAHTVLRNLLAPSFDEGFDYTDKGGTYANLFCAHPPFQIDGNFGGCSGIAEMFLQSHSGVVDILPALPDVMPEGSFKGLRVRGGGEVNASWSNKNLTEASLVASTDHKFKVKIPAKASKLSFSINGKPLNTEPVKGIIEIPLKKGEIFLMKATY